MCGPSSRPDRPSVEPFQFRTAHHAIATRTTMLIPMPAIQNALIFVSPTCLFGIDRSLGTRSARPVAPNSSNEGVENRGARYFAFPDDEDGPSQFGHGARLAAIALSIGRDLGAPVLRIGARLD